MSEDNEVRYEPFILVDTQFGGRMHRRAGTEFKASLPIVQGPILKDNLLFGKVR